MLKFRNTTSNHGSVFFYKLYTHTFINITVVNNGNRYLYKTLVLYYMFYISHSWLYIHTMWR